MWTPRPENNLVTYRGEQCLSPEEPTVLGFAGRDADDIEWQTFFEEESKLIYKAYSGG